MASETSEYNRLYKEIIDDEAYRNERFDKLQATLEETSADILNRLESLEKKFGEFDEWKREKGELIDKLLQEQKNERKGGRKKRRTRKRRTRRR